MSIPLKQGPPLFSLKLLLHGMAHGWCSINVAECLMPCSTAVPFLLFYPLCYCRPHFLECPQVLPLANTYSSSKLQVRSQLLWDPFLDLSSLSPSFPFHLTRPITLYSKYQFTSLAHWGDHVLNPFDGRHNSRSWENSTGKKHYKTTRTKQYKHCVQGSYILVRERQLTSE